MYEMRAETLREILELPTTAVLATVRGDGSPYTIPLWFLWEGEVPDEVDPVANPPSGHVWFSGRTTSIWAKHLQRDPRASLCIDVEGPPALHVGIDGPVESWTAAEFEPEPIMRRTVEKYVGRSDPANDEAVEGYLEMTKGIPQLHFKLTPTRWRAVDLSEFEAGQDV